VANLIQISLLNAASLPRLPSAGLMSAPLAYGTLCRTL